MAVAFGAAQHTISLSTGVAVFIILAPAPSNQELYAHGGAHCLAFCSGRAMHCSPVYAMGFGAAPPPPLNQINIPSSIYTRNRLNISSVKPLFEILSPRPFLILYLY